MEEPEEPKAGSPAWIVTFADLMSLLMCFFVLLLSFAEIDATKFKQLAESLEQAFGVQREVPAVQIPMGTSPIFDKFSPGKPQPTPLEEVRQTTTEEEIRLETQAAEVLAAVEQAVQQQMERTAGELENQLAQELATGILEIEQGPQSLTIRIKEHGSFASGTADATPQFRHILEKLGTALANIPGQMSIEGHTDNIPIRTARFQSNWDLSAARAASVANALIDHGQIDAERLRIQGHADTRPLVANDTPQNRATNRRVEIVLDLAEPADQYADEVLKLIQAGRLDEAAQLGWKQ